MSRPVAELLRVLQDRADVLFEFLLVHQTRQLLLKRVRPQPHILDRVELGDRGFRGAGGLQRRQRFVGHLAKCRQLLVDAKAGLRLPHQDVRLAHVEADFRLVIRRVVGEVLEARLGQGRVRLGVQLGPVHLLGIILGVLADFLVFLGEGPAVLEENQCPDHQQRDRHDQGRQPLQQIPQVTGFPPAGQRVAGRPGQPERQGAQVEDGRHHGPAGRLHLPAGTAGSEPPTQETKAHRSTCDHSRNGFLKSTAGVTTRAGPAGRRDTCGGSTRPPVRRIARTALFAPATAGRSS